MKNAILWQHVLGDDMALYPLEYEYEEDRNNVLIQELATVFKYSNYLSYQLFDREKPTLLAEYEYMLEEEELGDTDSDESNIGFLQLLLLPIVYFILLFFVLCPLSSFEIGIPGFNVLPEGFFRVFTKFSNWWPLLQMKLYLFQLL